MQQWKRKLVTFRRWVIQTRVRQFLFCKKSDEKGGKNFHRKNRKSYNNSPLSPHSRLQDAGALRWKIFSPLILHYFLTKPRPGWQYVWLTEPRARVSTQKIPVSISKKIQYNFNFHIFGPPFFKVFYSKLFQAKTVIQFHSQTMNTTFGEKNEKKTS